MMGVTIHVPREFTKTEVTQAMEAPGKTTGRTSGSWVHDLCALRKVITLCSFCQPKFNPGRLGYAKEKEFPIVQAKCDGCYTFDPRCAAYFWSETYHDVRSTAAERRATRTAQIKAMAKLK